MPGIRGWMPNTAVPVDFVTISMRRIALSEMTPLRLRLELHVRRRIDLGCGRGKRCITQRLSVRRDDAAATSQISFGNPGLTCGGQQQRLPGNRTGYAHPLVPLRNRPSAAADLPRTQLPNH